jgi:hypothetical protein
MPLNMAMQVRVPRLFVRGPTGAWCWNPLVKSRQTSATTDASPFTVLDSLRQSHARVERLGQDQIRGNAADHYRVLAKSPFDIWIDHQDRLVRQSETLTFRGLHFASTTDLFDFGTAVDVSTPPLNTPRCESP